jgi:positive phototaxis protein PixI
MVSAIQLANANTDKSLGDQAFGRSADLKIGATEERFLGFSIQPDTYALLSLNNLQGAIELPVSEVLPVPQMAPYLLGIVNWRGKSTWVADLAQFMGGEYYSQRCPQATKATALMVQVGTTTIGLVVDQTISVTTYDPALAIPIDDNFASAKTCRFLAGYFLDPTDLTPAGRTWLLIDLPRIFQAMNL